MNRIDRRNDPLHGLDTGTSVELKQLAIDSENDNHGFAYVASPPMLVRTLLANLPQDLSEYVFVDLGSGKGRVLLMASHYGFREVVGVEFAKELHEVATANINQYSHTQQQCHTIRSLHLDATKYDIPDSPCVVYFNNPFDETVMSQIIDNLEQRISASGSTIYVLYQQLQHEPQSDRTENIRLLRESPFLQEQKVKHPSLLSRLLLGSHRLNIFRSRDVTAVVT